MLRYRSGGGTKSLDLSFLRNNSNKWLLDMIGKNIVPGLSKCSHAAGWYPDCVARQQSDLITEENKLPFHKMDKNNTESLHLNIHIDLSDLSPS